VAFLSALSTALSHFEAGGSALYLHCWGGRGRAGLMGGCLLSLLCPELTGSEVLGVVQAAYSSRAGARQMPAALRQSPQTDEQRAFVRRFVERVQASGG
jgi:alanine transaminase